MKALAILVAAAPVVLASLAVRAQEATPDTWNVVAAPQSRAAVIAERAVPRPGGRMADYYFSDLARSTKTRAQVEQELQDARRSGEFAAIQAEAYVPPAPGVQPLQTAGVR